MLTTIALPHDWSNYGEMIETFKTTYGLEVNELNPDAGSGDDGLHGAGGRQAEQGMVAAGGVR